MSLLAGEFGQRLPVGELFFAQGIGRRYAYSHADVFVAARGFRAEAAPADTEPAPAGRTGGDVHFHFAVEGGYAFLRAEYGFPWSQRNLADDIMAVHAEHGMSGIMHGKVKIACRITGIALAAQAELAAVADTSGDGDLEAGSRAARAERDLLGTASASLFQRDVYFGLDVGTATRTARTAAKAAETAKAIVAAIDQSVDTVEATANNALRVANEAAADAAEALQAANNAIPKPDPNVCGAPGKRCVLTYGLNGNEMTYEWEVVTRAVE